jgi:glycosyltransferase involved in cell wall biosynthesis
MNKCAVLIPHFNDPTGLYESLRSITPDERLCVFVVDDGSNLKPDEIEAREIYRGELKFIYSPSNQGIDHALNAGLEHIGESYAFIARLDCGDTCAKDRFSKQIEYLEAHPFVMLVGSAVSFVTEEGEISFTLRLPTTSDLIRRAMFSNCAFIHPTVMWRASVMSEIGFYPTTYPAAEDYALFWKFVERYRTANLPEVLVFSKLSPNGISARRRAVQLRSRLRIQREHLTLNAASLLGVAKTLTLMVIPRNIVTLIKRFLLEKDVLNDAA